MIIKIQKLFILLFLYSISTFVFSQSENTESNDKLNSIFDNGKYVLSPGDIVSVTVFGEPDISVSSLKVPLSGVYNYPLLGEIKITNETMPSLAKLIESGLRAGFLSDPKVSVNIEHYRPVFVTGAVEEAGILAYQAGMTVRILSAIAKVDISSLDINHINIQRNSESFNPPDFESLVFPGDIVSFKSQSRSVGDFYYIYGEVNHAGKYEFEEGLTIEKAVIVAGGYSPFASKRNIRVRRDGSEDVLKMRIHEAIESGDVITIKKRWF